MSAGAGEEVEQILSIGAINPSIAGACRKIGLNAATWIVTASKV
jgi:hypothetical protein